MTNTFPEPGTCEYEDWQRGLSDGYDVAVALANRLRRAQTQLRGRQQ